MKNNWEIKTLGEVGIVYNGNSINEKVKKDNYTNIEEGYPFIATKDIQVNSVIDYDNGVKIPFNEKHLFKIAPQNTPLICMEGGSAGRKIGYTNKEVCFGNKLLALIPKSKNYNSKYFYYFYFSGSFQKSFNQYLLGIIGGVSIKNFKEIPIPIPPIKEQEEIVERLDKGFELIDSLKETAKKNLDNAKELFQSVLREELSPKEGWETKTLGEVCEKTKTINPLTEPNRLFKYIDVSCVDNKRLCVENFVEIIGKEAPSRARKLIQTNDIIFATVRPTLKRISIIDDKFHNEVCSTGYIVLKAKKDINFKLIFYFLQLDSFIEQMGVLQKGASYPAVVDNDVKNQLISFSESIKEQEDIVNRLDRIKGYCEELEGNYKRVLELCEELKQGLLREAFEVK